jgi:acyl carrier protein
MTPSNFEKLTNIFRLLFNEPELELSKDMTAQDVANWDSLNHVNLIVAIEGEINIRFSSSEISDLQDVGALMDLVDKKLDG